MSSSFFQWWRSLLEQQKMYSLKRISYLLCISNFNQIEFKGDGEKIWYTALMNTLSNGHISDTVRTDIRYYEVVEQTSRTTKIVGDSLQDFVQGRMHAKFPELMKFKSNYPKLRIEWITEREIPILDFDYTLMKRRPELYEYQYDKETGHISKCAFYFKKHELAKHFLKDHIHLIHGQVEVTAYVKNEGFLSIHNGKLYVRSEM